MQQSIVDRIAHVKNAARRLAVLRSLGIVLAIGLATLLVAGWCDVLLKFEDRGTRFLLSLGCLVAIAVAVWHFLLPTLQAKWTNESVARMIERRFPHLHGRLSSALGFLSSSGSDFGSKPLMRNVIATTSTDVAELNLKDAIDPGPTWRALGWTMLSAAVCAVCFSLSPAMTGKAATRLLTPWARNPWPRTNYLRFVDPPNRVGRGSDVKLVLVDDSGKLPPTVNLELLYEGETDATTVPMQRMVADTDDGSVTQMVYDKSRLGRSFRYRATGGDDQNMGWSDLKVVEPPQLVTGSVTLEPPAYTGWQPRTTSELSSGFRLLEGTNLTLTGTADRPLKDAWLSVQSSDTENNYAAAFSTDGLQFETRPWQVTESADYAMTLVDRKGTMTIDAEQWNMRVLKDAPPALQLKRPDAAELITPRAIVPLECAVEDDLAIRQVTLRYGRSDRSGDGEQRVVLLDNGPVGAETPMPDSLPTKADQTTVTQDWPLESLKLPPGAMLSFQLVADDYKGQSGQTVPRRLVVVSESDLIDRVGRRQSMVLSRLQQRLKRQRRSMEDVEAVQLQLGETQHIDNAVMDRLKSAMLGQRQVNSAMVGEDSEVIRELAQLKRLLDRSRVGEVDVRDRVEKTLDSIRKLGREQLEPAMQHGYAATQSLQAERERQQRSGGNSADDRDEVAVPEDVPQQLRLAAGHQSEAVQTLEKLLDEMSAWDNYRRFGQELNELLRQQRDVREATGKVARETLSREGELDGQQRAALRSTAMRQLDLARRAERSLENLEKARELLAESDPQASQMVEDAMQAAADSALAGNMREAGRQIDQNRPGLAAEQQRRAEQALEEMLSELSRRTYSREERVEKMEDAERELQRLQKRQAQLSRELEAAERDPGRKRELQRLQKRQEQVAAEAQKLQRQLKRLGANRAAAQAGQAGDSMQRAGEAAQRDQVKLAQEQSQLAEQQMEQAQQALQREQEEAKAELAQEQMVRMPQLIDGLIGRQTALNEEVLRLDAIRAERGAFTSGQQISVEVAADTQRRLADDTADVANDMSQLPAFVFALEEVQKIMRDCAVRLADLNTDESTRKLGIRVAEELQMIRDMMEKETPERNSQQQDGGGGGQGGQQQNGQQQDFDARIAQLKLLRGMQIRINDDTRDLNGQNPERLEDRDALIADAERLADRQGKLARIVEDLVAPQRAPQLDLPGPPKNPVDGDVDGDLPQDGLDALDRELDLLLQ